MKKCLGLLHTGMGLFILEMADDFVMPRIPKAEVQSGAEDVVCIGCQLATADQLIIN